MTSLILLGLLGAIAVAGIAGTFVEVRRYGHRRIPTDPDRLPDRARLPHRGRLPAEPDRAPDRNHRPAADRTPSTGRGRRARGILATYDDAPELGIRRS